MVKLFVGNLVEDIDDSIIRSLFEEYGTVEECDVLGKFGFVHMPDESSAKDAIKNLNGRFVEGRKMNVEISTSTVRGSGRGYGRGGERGSRGGRGRGGFRGGRGGGSDWGGRGGFSGRGGRGRGGMDRYAPYPRSRGGMGGGDYYDSYQEQRLKVAAEALRQFDEAYGTDGYGGGSGFGGGNSGDPYARPPPEYYNDKGDFGRSGGYGGYDKGRRGGFYQGY